MYKIDAERIDLVEEFKAKPFGPHSREVKRMLNRMRYGDMRNREVLVCVERHKVWVLGRLSGKRDTKIELDHNRRYTSLAMAEWEIFKRRWEAHTGRSLDGLIEDPMYGRELGAARR